MSKWLSPIPSKCEICQKSLKKTFVDGYTPFGWALMCERCHQDLGKGFGIGKGQLFDLETRNCLKGGFR